MSPATPIKGFNIVFLNNAWRELFFYNGCQTIKGHALSAELITISLTYSARKTRAKKQAGDSNRSSLYLLDDDQYDAYQELNLNHNRRV